MQVLIRQDNLVRGRLSKNANPVASLSLSLFQRERDRRNARKGVGLHAHIQSSVCVCVGGLRDVLIPSERMPVIVVLASQR